jgi:periplasmic protein TonB
VKSTAQRSSLGAVVSISVHCVIMAFLALQPCRGRAHGDVVNLTFEKPSKPPLSTATVSHAPPPPLDPEPAPRARRASPPKAPAAAPKAPEPAPPTFDLGAGTFAMEGGAWGLRPSEGDSTLGAFSAAKGAVSPRDARPSLAAEATGFRPIPTTDLARRPEPERGAIATPPYPNEAKRNGIEGAVVLRVEITKEGRVRSARVVEDPGGGLGAAAYAAMLRERWRPALDRSGSPVDTVITYSYRFVLEG